MPAEVIPLKRVGAAKAEPTVNLDAIASVEGLLARLKSGEAVAAAFVEVSAQPGVVGVYYSPSSDYHRLCSGCARLAARIALD